MDAEYIKHDLELLLILIVEARRWQKEYFASKSIITLRQAQGAEKKLDAFIRKLSMRYKSDPDRPKWLQQDLF